MIRWATPVWSDCETPQSPHCMAMQLLGVQLCRIVHAWTCAVLEHVPPLQVVLGSSYIVYSAYWRTQVVTLLKITAQSI